MKIKHLILFVYISSLYVSVYSAAPAAAYAVQQNIQLPGTEQATNKQLFERLFSSLPLPDVRKIVIDYLSPDYRPDQNIIIKDQSKLNYFALSDNGEYFITVSSSSSFGSPSVLADNITIWKRNHETFIPFSTIKAHNIYGVTISPTGKYIVFNAIKYPDTADIRQSFETESYVRIVYALQDNSYKEIMNLGASNYAGQTIFYIRNNQLFLADQKPDKIVIWKEDASGKFIYSQEILPTSIQRKILRINFAQDSAFILEKESHNNYILHLWKLDNQNRYNLVNSTVMNAHKMNNIQSFSGSKNGKYVVITLEDYMIMQGMQIWNIQDNKLVCIYTKNQPQLLDSDESAISFNHTYISTDGSYVVMSDHNKIEIWQQTKSKDGKIDYIPIQSIIMNNYPHINYPMVLPFVPTDAYIFMRPNRDKNEFQFWKSPALDLKLAAEKFL
jgi:hypothetical protein